MKKLIVALGLCAGLGLTTGSAFADGAIQFTSHDRDVTATISFDNPCTGTVQDVEITFSGLNHMVVRPTGTFMSNGNIHGTYTILPDGPSGTFTSVSVVAGGANTASTTVLVARADDGSLLRFQIHMTTNGQGELIVNSYKGCRD